MNDYADGPMLKCGFPYHNPGISRCQRDFSVNVLGGVVSVAGAGADFNNSPLQSPPFE